jgi:hypothetical protein
MIFGMYFQKIYDQRMKKVKLPSMNHIIFYNRNLFQQ